MVTMIYNGFLWNNWRKTILKVLDLFSGIGMFSYGLEKTELYETKLFVEVDKSCQKVLNKHWPNVKVHDDIKTLSTCENEFDVIVGGFPCQDLSVANQNAKGLEGERSGLWTEYFRLIKEVKPKGIIIENVSALRNRGLHQILYNLNSVGYNAEWHCITARHYGACHERDRIFILAYPNSIRVQGFKPNVCLKEIGQRRESWQKDLQQVFRNPFGRSNSCPQSLLRREDDGYSSRVDRLKQLGNTIYNPIVTDLGKYLAKTIKDT